MSAPRDVGSGAPPTSSARPRFSTPSSGTPTTHLVLLPDLATGHLMSLIQAGIRIGRHDGRRSSTVITVLLVHPPTPASAAKVAARLERVVDSSVVRVHRLPPLDDGTMEAFSPDELPAFKSRYMQLYAPHVKAALAALRPAPGAVLLDFFATPVLDALDVPAYVYFTSSAAFLSLMLRLPTLHQELTLDFADMDGTVQVPGIASPVPAASMPAVLARRDTLTYDWFVYHGRRFPEADGIVVNTVAELEPTVLDAVVATGGAPPLYPIGPVIDVSITSTAAGSRCVAWLDAQPAGSVVYLCFGSVGWLEPEQARELATGLERSGHRFLWVLRGPPAPGPGSGSHQLTDGEEAAKLLPAGFLDRTAARGMVWPAWAPQKDILAHAAVGAFVTHAGWNSCLESLWHGLPMVPWPLYAEQHLNAFQAVAEMGVAVALDGAPPPRKLVEAAAVERAVRSVMGETQEGRTARDKAVQMKHYFRDAVDGGGSSHAAMQRLCDDIRSRAATAAAAVMAIND